MAVVNIIQLRQLLAERFPHARFQAGSSRSPAQSGWPTGLAPIDDPLGGGLPRGAITEVIAEHAGTGSASLLGALIHQAAEQHELVALVDGQDSLDVCGLSLKTCSNLLWMRCRTAAESLKATDLVLRDNNLRVVLLDLVSNPQRQLRAIPATTWYRFQRILEQTSTVFVVLTPHALVAAAQTRLTLTTRFSLETLEYQPEMLLHELKVEISDPRFVETQRTWHRSA